jgi:HCOMODA/2-hydroxy-3-carboxy-muconic semialdehyde decarboxylase
MCFCTPSSRARLDRALHRVLLEWNMVDAATQLAAGPELVDTLVVANRILYRQGVVDGFGHVSARHDKSPGHFLLARNMAPGLVRRDDIITFDLDGTALDAEGRRVYLERFIHSEIYRARPDVRAIVHSHSPSVIPFGVTGQPLRPIFHMSGFLGEGAALFEIREVAGDTDMLISDRRLGAALAAALGARSTVLMRGHGSTVVGGSIEQAVYRAIYAEVNAKLQLQAVTLGEVTYLNLQEAAKAAAINDTQLARTWELWLREIGTIE